MKCNEFVFFIVFSPYKVSFATLLWTLKSNTHIQSNWFKQKVTESKKKIHSWSPHAPTLTAMLWLSIVCSVVFVVIFHVLLMMVFVFAIVSCVCKTCQCMTLIRKNISGAFVFFFAFWYPIWNECLDGNILWDFFIFSSSFLVLWIYLFLF